jgi:carnitine 3-dehydrogenase
VSVAGEGFEPMLFLRQVCAAIVLVMLTLGMQSAGMAGLIEWAKSHFARGAQALGSWGSAVLVVRFTSLIICLHNSIIASSSSGITMDVIQSGCKRPERCVIGHPFNPPHVVPLVEVVGGAKTSEATIERAMAFYAGVGKKAVRLYKALPGHVANRFQAALYKEVLYLVQQGVLSVADADVAVCYGPGIRWGVMGPSLQWHVGGGEGGIKHFMEHLMDPLAAMMKSLGTPEITPQLKQTVVDAVLKEAAGRSVEDLAREENSVHIGLLKLRSEAKA